MLVSRILTSFEAVEETLEICPAHYQSTPKILEKAVDFSGWVG
jgi:hypothetical protein